MATKECVRPFLRSQQLQQRALASLLGDRDEGQGGDGSGTDFAVGVRNTRRRQAHRVMLRDHPGALNRQFAQRMGPS